MTIRPSRARLLPLAAACSLLLLPAARSAQTSSKAAATAAAPKPASPTGVAISPDGATVAWTVRGAGAAILHLTQVADPASTQDVPIQGASNCADKTPIWSPDGEALAFLSTCTGETSKPDQEQIFLWSKATGKVSQLTHLTGELQQPAWSPDGRSIAFLFVQDATRHAGALDAMPPWSGVIGEDHIEIQRVYAVNSTTGAGGFLTPANLYVYEFDWAPSSRKIAFIAANPPGANNWWIAKLYSEPVSSSAVSATTGSRPRIVLDPNTVPGSLHGLQIAVPRYSPNGKRIAFIGGLMSDQGSTGGDVYVVAAKGGDPIDVTPAIDGTPTYIAWAGNQNLRFTEDRRGHLLLTDYAVSTGKQDAVDDLGEVRVYGGPIKNAISVSTDSTLNATFAFVKTSFNAPPEIWSGGFDSLRQLTHLSPAAAKNASRFEAFQSIEWKDDGFHVQGWLTFPENYDPARKYPLIVEVHGGPSASAGPRPNTMWSEQGYFVLEPNPRGSFGEGEAFVQANRKDFGYGDLRDILKGVDTVEAGYPIDKTREGITGWSYGGFMTMFAVTQTHRFRAAVAGAGVSDWLSYYGENSIDQWMIPFFGASVYDDPAVYAKSSAINYIKNVTTPTLVIVGDRDGECPAPQSFEFWHALRDLGVKTELVVYPDEGHGFRNPEHIRDRDAREIRWFAENMPAGK